MIHNDQHPYEGTQDIQYFFFYQKHIIRHEIL